MSETCLIIGAGSIGQRHFEVLTDLGFECSFVTKRTDLNNVQTFVGLQSALEQCSPSYVVVANETVKHSETIIELNHLGFSGKVMVEKPLDFLKVHSEQLNFKQIGVAFNLRFHPIIQRLQILLKNSKICSVSITAGQHLSTWRPSRELKRQYSAHKSLGGGVLRDLSHEFDYSQLLFGRLDLVGALGGKFGNVTFDSDDSWAILAKSDAVPQISIQLSYLDRIPVREIRIVTESKTIVADLVASTIFDGSEVESFSIERNDTYRTMHISFLNNEGPEVTSLAEAQEIDSLIFRIENQSAELER